MEFTVDTVEWPVEKVSHSRFPLSLWRINIRHLILANLLSKKTLLIGGQTTMFVP